VRNDRPHTGTTQVNPRKDTTIMTETKPKTRTITLTGRRPVTIDEAEWPVIAKASGDNWTGGADWALHNQASDQGQLDEFTLRVREHADGRGIVYGTYSEGWHSDHDGLTHAGYIVQPGSVPLTVEAAIQQTGTDLGVPAQLVADCIADLPAERL
jgi:hypothetical protein